MSNSEITSDKDLWEICKKYGIKLNGIFSKNLLPTSSLKDGAYIINLQNSNVGNGTHWTCFFIRGNQMAYFDSFGIDEPEILEKLDSRYDYSENYKQLQDINDSCCGYFCIAFLLYCTKSRLPLSECIILFTNLFGNDMKENKYILKRLLKQHYTNKR